MTEADYQKLIQSLEAEIREYREMLGISVFCCRQCSTVFRRGVGQKRRGDAKFCSNRCKVKYNSLLRSRPTARAIADELHRRQAERLKEGAGRPARGARWRSSNPASIPS